MDRKWDELSKILQNDPHMRDAGGRQRKMIIFTEHRDTLNYLQRRIAGVLGSPMQSSPSMVACIVMNAASARPCSVLTLKSAFCLATDAAGEGVNLQNANLMVNYDLPWNPNRLEQRFGRIHRIGQQEVCHLWNLVAKETREGDVYSDCSKNWNRVSEAFHGRYSTSSAKCLRAAASRICCWKRSATVTSRKSAPTSRPEASTMPSTTAHRRHP